MAEIVAEQEKKKVKEVEEKDKPSEGAGDAKLTVTPKDEHDVGKQLQQSRENESKVLQAVGTLGNLSLDASEKIVQEPGHVHIEKTDNGGTQTVVDKTENKTFVKHGTESVTIEGGKEVVKGPGYQVNWDDLNRRHVSLESGRELIRDGNNVLLQDKSGDVISVKPGVLDASDSNISFVDNKNDLDAMTRAKIKALHEGEAALIAVKDAGTRTIFSNGTIIDAQNNSTRIETADHKVLQLQLRDSKLFILNDKNEMVPLEGSNDSSVKLVDGKYTIGGMQIDSKTLKISTDGAHEGNDKVMMAEYSLDLQKNSQHLLDSQGHQWNTTIDRSNNTRVDDLAHDRTFANNHNDSSVSITSRSVGGEPETLKVDLKTTAVDLNNKIVDDPNKTLVKGTNTVIDGDRTVHLGGANGPTVKADGTVQVDKNTSVGNDMKVYQSGSGSSGRYAQGSPEANAQDAAATVSSQAAGICGVAHGSEVSWGDIGALNSALGDVAGLMGSVAGDSPAYAMLLSSYSSLVEAINVATPKVMAAENAKGLGLDTKQAPAVLEKEAAEKREKKAS